VVLAIAAGIAIRQLWEARRLRESQARPFVVVDLEVEPAQQTISIVITNTGGTIARNVKVTFEPDLESSFDSRGSSGLIRDLKPLREGIGTLPPGKRVSLLFDIFTQREGETFPDVYVARVRFDAPALKKRGLEENVRARHRSLSKRVAHRSGGRPRREQATREAGEGSRTPRWLRASAFCTAMTASAVAH
jgi:hypothetical protein